MPPASAPGEINTDVKGPLVTSVLRDRSELLKATELMIAEFNGLVGVRTDENGKQIGERPKVHTIVRDHEGQFESHQYTDLRAKEHIHDKSSPPYDHDLNGIAERIIRTIDEKATAMRTFAADDGNPARLTTHTPLPPSSAL